MGMCKHVVKPPCEKLPHVVVSHMPLPLLGQVNLFQPPSSMCWIACNLCTITKQSLSPDLSSKEPRDRQMTPESLKIQ